ncbi:fructokinase [Sphingomonas naasensis]|nr:ROK family protein [Sphingomonas naasensis]NIJ20292.1 fructokinase [Sphingomonas naasensis]
MAMRIGIDLGGTKIEIAAIDSDGVFVARERIATPRDYDGTIRAITGLAAGLDARLGRIDRIGIGIPGAVSRRTGEVRNANARFLNGRPFERDLIAALGRPVKVANDADCFALSEAERGEGTVFGAILGTGCGGGVVVEGRLLPGAAAGEWGHNPLPSPDRDETEGPECWCGRRGCIETWVSGTGFARDYRANHGGAASAEAIVAAARSGEAAALAALDRYVERLARALAGVVNVIDPDAIVLGGGMSNVDEIYAPLPAAVRLHVFCAEWSGTIRAPRFGDSSGVRGAAQLWDQSGFEARHV